MVHMLWHVEFTFTSVWTINYTKFPYKTWTDTVTIEQRSLNTSISSSIRKFLHSTFQDVEFGLSSCARRFQPTVFKHIETLNVLYNRVSYFFLSDQSVSQPVKSRSFWSRNTSPQFCVLPFREHYCCHVTTLHIVVERCPSVLWRLMFEISDRINGKYTAFKHLSIHSYMFGRGNR